VSNRPTERPGVPMTTTTKAGYNKEEEDHKTRSTWWRQAESSQEKEVH